MSLFQRLHPNSEYHCKAQGPNQDVIGEVDRQLIDQALQEIGSPEQWPAVKRDQHHILEQGRSLILRDHRHKDTEQRGRYPAFEKLVEQVLSLGYGTAPGKIVAAYLPPGRIIKPHRDSGEYYTFHNRIHVPLVTSDDVIMEIEGEHFHMDVGKVYLFQNLRRHAARNGSQSGRIHLIMDVLDPRYSAAIYRRWWPVLASNFFWGASVYRYSRFLAAEKQRAAA